MHDIDLTLTVRPWHPHDPAGVDTYGAFSAYVETFWLPLIGPTATWCYRRLASLAENYPDGCIIDESELAGQLGVTIPALRKTIERLAYFQFLVRRGHTNLAVRTTVRRLSALRLQKLTPQLRDLHARHYSTVEAVSA